MKYVIVIPDGAADDPVAELGHRTPLQAARLPNMDRVARRGVVGRSLNVPPSLTPGSDVATLSLAGYDPLAYYTGRAPLEAAALGVPLGPDDWAVRCNLVYFPDGRMDNFTAGHIPSADGRELLAALQEQVGGQTYSGGFIDFHPGVSYRNLMTWRGRPGAGSPLAGTRTQAPHDVPGQPVDRHLPAGPGRDLLIELMGVSKEVFADHPANRRRIAAGQLPATQVWLWGQGKAPALPPFRDVYGARGAVIAAVDLVRGVGALAGWDRIDVPGATGYLDTDYAAKGRYAVDAVAAYDLVCVHVEAPDEASHEGRADAKVAALEQIDEHVVGPLLDVLPKYPRWRLLVEPDHRTTLASRAHSHGPVPFAAVGTGLAGRGQLAYDEPTAAASDLAFDPGWELMGWFVGK